MAGDSHIKTTKFKDEPQNAHFKEKEIYYILLNDINLLLLFFFLLKKRSCITHFFLCLINLFGTSIKFNPSVTSNSVSANLIKKLMIQ